MMGGLREYARHRGVDPRAVSQAIKDGRIKRGSNGKIDFEKADAAWEENSAPRIDDAIKRGGPSEVPVTVNAYAKARAMREAYAAQLAKLEFEERAGKLIEAEKVRNAWAQVCVAIRSAVNGMPQKLAPKVFAARDLREVNEIIESECRDLLRQLSTGITDLSKGSES